MNPNQVDRSTNKNKDFKKVSQPGLIYNALL